MQRYSCKQTFARVSLQLVIVPAPGEDSLIERRRPAPWARPRAWCLAGRSSVRRSACCSPSAQRLTQCLLQLAANAVQHTVEGDVIAFGGTSDHARLRLWVRDEGSRDPRRRAGAHLRQVPPRSRLPPRRQWTGTRRRRPHRRGARRHGEREFHTRPRREVPHRHPAQPRGAAMNRILVAEDEERIASFIEKGLRANGFRSEVVSDGNDAVIFAQRRLRPHGARHRAPRSGRIQRAATAAR